MELQHVRVVAFSYSSRTVHLRFALNWNSASSSLGKATQATIESNLQLVYSTSTSPLQDQKYAWFNRCLIAANCSYTKWSIFKNYKRDLQDYLGERKSAKAVGNQVQRFELISANKAQGSALISLLNSQCTSDCHFSYSPWTALGS